MPIVSKPEYDENKLPWRIRMRESVCKEIEEYCEWAGITYRDYFLEQACMHIFNIDAEWREYKAKHDIKPSNDTGLPRPEKEKKKQK
jgi:hypothetical protein